jgi:hypothetical protein
LRAVAKKKKKISPKKTLTHRRMLKTCPENFKRNHMGQGKLYWATASYIVVCTSFSAPAWRTAAAVGRYLMLFRATPKEC